MKSPDLLTSLGCTQASSVKPLGTVWLTGGTSGGSATHWLPPKRRLPSAPLSIRSVGSGAAWFQFAVPRSQACKRLRLASPARSPSDVANATHAKPGAPIVFRVARDGVESDVTVVPEASDEGGRRVGLAGLRLKVDPEAARRIAITVRSGPVDALGQGVRKTWELSTFTLRMLGRMITGDASLKNLSGPITLADFAGQSAQAGVLVFVGYLALISISLGVLNLLPIPLLDGGHLLYYLAEIVLGRPVSDRAFEVGQRIGMALLAVLMTLALVNDVSRLF